MGQGAIDYIGVKGGLKLNDVIEEFKYVYKGQEITAGDFVEFVNGVSSQTTTIKTTSNTTFHDKEVLYISAVKLNDNSVFVAYSDGESIQFGTRVLTINDENITVGTEYIMGNAPYDISTTLVSANKVAICFANNSDYKTSAIIAVIDGTTISFGTSLVFGTGTSSYGDNTTQIEALDETKLLASWIRLRTSASTSSSYGLKACVLTLNGTTLTANTTLNIQTSRQTNQSLCKLSSSRALISYGDRDATTGSSRVLTISGTSVSTSSKYDFSTVSVSSKTSCLISSDKVLIIYMRTSSIGYASVIATISPSNTITFGSTYTIDNSYTVYPKSSCLVETNKILVSFNENGTNNCLQILNVSGTSVISNGDKYLLGAGKYHIDTVLMQENRVVTIYNSTDTTNHGNSQVLGISGNNISNEIKIKIPQYEQQVTLSTQPPFDGIALSSGVGGTDTAHNEQVKIARPITEQDIYVFETFTSSPIPTSWANGEDGLTATATNDYGEWSLRTTKGPWTTGTNLGVITDGNDDTGWRFARFSSDSEVAYMYLTPPAGVEINPTSIYVYNNMCSSSSYNSSHRSKVQGYDGSNWIDLGTLNSGTTGVKQTFTISGDTFFSEFRLKIYRLNATYNTEVYIYEFQVREGTIRCLKPEYQ